MADIHVPTDYTTIQSAIDAAQDGDQVIVANGVYNEQINFDGKNIIVRSKNGARTTIIDGTDINGALVTFSDGESASAVLNGFTIRNGTNNNGAGMRIVGANPTIIDVIFYNNIATTDGGGVFIDDGGATFTDCVFVNNVAGDDGGAVNMDDSGTVAFTRCRFSFNSAYDKGGAIYTRDSTHLNVHRSIFEHNESETDNGGGIYISGLNTLVITDSHFYKNHADEDGGAIRAGSVDDLHITDTMFVSNTANLIAGALRITNCGTSMIVGCAFRDNAALADDNDGDGYGGAIQVHNSDTLTIFGSMFANNYAALDGGAIDIGYLDDFTIEHSIFVSNSAEEDGGAIYIAQIDNDLIITDSQFIGNYAEDDGGAIYIDDTSNTYITDTLFRNNESLNAGGAIYTIASSYITYENVDFIGNISDVTGGAVHIYENSQDIAFENCRFIDNICYGYGGAVYIGSADSDYTIRFFECVFEENWSGIEGGAIFVPTSIHAIEIEIERSLFHKNHAQSSGGAIFSNASSLDVAKSTLTENFSAGAGGAIYTRYITASDSSFVDNSASSHGGAVHVHTSASGIFNRCNFANNTSNSQGGAIYNPSSVFNSVFDRNTASSSGGAIVSINNNNYWVNVRNSTFYNNSGSFGNSIWNNSTSTLLYNNIFWGSNSELALHQDATVDRNTVQNGYGNGTNISSANPLFVNTSQSNFRLQLGSPAIDAGNNAYVSGMGNQDHQRAIRIAGTVDHGAYEFNSGTLELESNALAPVQWTPNESVQLMWVAAGGPAVTYYLTVYGENDVELMVAAMDASYMNCTSGTGMCVLRLDDKILHPNSMITGWAVSARNELNQEIWDESESIDPTGETDGAVPFEPVGTFSGGHNLAFTWQADPMAVYYLLSVTDVTGNTITKWYATSEVGCEDGYGLCTATPSKPLKSGVASWNVTSLNETGYNAVDMVTSDSRDIRVLPLSVALPIGPTTMTFEFNPAYHWHAVSGATWYLLWVNDETGNVVRQWYSKAHLGCVDDNSICTAQPTENLTGAAKWWVQAWNEGDLHGKWSHGETFNAPVLSSPELLLPADQGYAIFMPLFMWEPTHGSSWYRVWVNDETGANVISTWLAADAVNCENGTGDCRIFIPTTLLEPGDYKWWVQGWNDVQGHGPWSAGWTFTVAGNDLP